MQVEEAAVSQQSTATTPISVTRTSTALPVEEAAHAGVRLHQTNAAVLTAEELDATGEELAQALRSAEELANVFPHIVLAQGDETLCIADVDVAHILVARALSADEIGLNPDPALDVPERIARRVASRALETYGPPIAQGTEHDSPATSPTGAGPRLNTSAKSSGPSSPESQRSHSPKRLKLEGPTSSRPAYMESSLSLSSVPEKQRQSVGTRKQGRPPTSFRRGVQPDTNQATRLAQKMAEGLEDLARRVELERTGMPQDFECPEGIIEQVRGGPTAVPAGQERTQHKSASPDSHHNARWPGLMPFLQGATLKTVQCDVCDTTYHVTCVGFEFNADLSAVDFECPACVAAKTEGKAHRPELGCEQYCLRPDCPLRDVPLATDEYFVKRILGQRPSKEQSGQHEYLVEWDGWTLDHATWEPAQALNEHIRLIEEFRAAAITEGQSLERIDETLCLKDYVLPAAALDLEPPSLDARSSSPAEENDELGTVAAPSSFEWGQTLIPGAPLRPPKSLRSGNAYRSAGEPSTVEQSVLPIPPEDDWVYSLTPFTWSDVPDTPLKKGPRPPIPPYDPTVKRSRPHGRSHREKRTQASVRSRPLEVYRPPFDDHVKLVVEELSRSQPGWRGHIKKTPLIREVISSWGTPRLLDFIKHMRIVPYRGMPTMICDRNGRGVVYRDRPVHDHAGEDLVGKFTEDAQLFAQLCPISPGDRLANSRGAHYASIMGAHRQYASKPYETFFQQTFRAEILWLMRARGPAERITSHVMTVLRSRFPEVVKRMERNKDWHAQHSGLRPMFGLFWNFCINVDSGVRRVFCRPHGDTMNVAAFLCAIMAFWDSKWLREDQWSWIVLWELGLILACPRGSVVLYPSALLFHFNVRVVKCKKGEKPTPENSEELVADGTGRRGSAVWFSQSTMYSCSNEKDDKTGSFPDYEKVARTLFPQVMDPIPSQASGAAPSDGELMLKELVG